MPYVLMQPSLPDNKLSTSNAFFIISYASYTALHGETAEISLGGINLEGGRFKVQAFRKSAMRCMKLCVVLSTLGFLGSMWAMDYSLAFAIVLYGAPDQ